MDFSAKYGRLGKHSLSTTCILILFFSMYGINLQQGLTIPQPNNFNFLSFQQY